MQNNDEQHPEPKRLGGVTGRGFLPGKSGNPNGRPRTKGLITALRAKVAEIAPDGRTLEAHLVDVLLQEALRGRHRLAAVETIFDRLEGRPRHRLEVADISEDLRKKSIEELTFYLAHLRWPEPDELLELQAGNMLQESDQLGGQE